MIRNEECTDDEDGANRTAPERILCVKTMGGNLCSGDSGGPLYVWTSNVTWVQVGVTSGIKNGDCLNGNALFTKLSHFTGWIHRRISGCRNYPTSEYDRP